MTQADGCGCTTHLDSASNGYWIEDMRNESAARREGARFWTDAQRSQFIEGKIGMRESIALKNVPPIAATA